MNIPSQPSTLNNTAFYPTEFQQLIREKSENFVGRRFVFAAITDFLHCHRSGYFTLVGTPGSGKSTIIAKYSTENPAVVYYNAQVSGKNRVDQFLTSICTQLINHYLLDEKVTIENSPYLSLPNNANQAGIIHWVKKY